MPEVRRNRIPLDVELEAVAMIKNGFPKKEIVSSLKMCKKALNKILDRYGVNYSYKKFTRCTDTHKQCRKCNRFLELKYFNDEEQGVMGKVATCFECAPKISKELKSIKHAEYRNQNKGLIKSRKLNDRLTGKKALWDKNHYERTKHIPEYRIKRLLRSSLSELCKERNIIKKSKTLNILGYSAEELIKRLESQFQPGMSWDNYGRNGWHIDHKKPLASFDLKNSEDIKEAFSLDNLQPLWESDNCSKGSLYQGKRYSILK